MKPTTRLQKEVVALSSQLKPLTEKHFEFGKSLFKKKLFTTYYNKAYCECGNISKLKPITCNCNSEFAHNKSERAMYLSVLDTINEFQVIRYLYCVKTIDIKGFPNYKNSIVSWKFTEVAQHWLESPRGFLTTMARSVRQSFSYNDDWNTNSPMEIKMHHKRTDFNCDVYPIQKVLPILKRNGYKTTSHNLPIYRLFQMLLTDSMAETLLKAKYPSLLQEYYKRPHRIDTWWHGFKMAHRNGYKIPKDAHTWCDHAGMLKDMGATDPKLYCPTNLKADHQKLIDRVARIEAKRDFERRKEEIEEANKAYVKRIKKYAKFKVAIGELEIRPLLSVNEFYEHGTKLRHCIFSNAYYERKHSLLLGAFYNNAIVENIEVNLKDLTIEQSRGFGNKSTRYHSEIIKALTPNLKQLQFQKTKKINI